MSRNWRSSGRGDGDGDGDGGDGDGGGDGPRELMSWDALQHTSTKDIVLFCIDAGPHMHARNPDTGVSYLHSALLAACRLQESKLVMSPHDRVGILLFGTLRTDVQDHLAKGAVYSHCTVLQPIDQVDVRFIVDLYDLLADDETGVLTLDQVDLTAPYPKLFVIEHALGNAVHYLMAQGKTGYKRIFYITNNDNPTVFRTDVTQPAPVSSSAKRDTKSLRKCLAFVNEAGQRNIELEPLFISSTKHEFKVDEFYAEVFAAYDDPLDPTTDDDDVSALASDSDPDSDSDLDDERILSQLGIAPTTTAALSHDPTKARSKAEAQARKLDRKTRREQRETRHRRLYDCALRMGEIQQALEERQMPKRVVFNTTLEVIEGTRIGVKGYAMIARATRGTPVRVIKDGDTYTEVGVKAIPVCDDTGEILQPKKDVETAFSFGGAAAAASYHLARLADPADSGEHGGPGPARDGVLPRSRSHPNFQQGGEDAAQAALVGNDAPVGRGRAKFSKDEVREMREMGVPHGIRILGFKPQAKLEFWMNTKHAVFLYPTDETMEGSRRFFASLLRSMAKKRVFALALCLPRTGMTPFFAALWPREEEVSEEGRQLAAPGLFMIPLPFADDMRDKPWDTSAHLKARPEETAAAKRVVKKYTYSNAFTPDAYANPALALHYATIRAVAFNRETPVAVGSGGSRIGRARREAEEALLQDGDGEKAKEERERRREMGSLGTLLRQVRSAEEVRDDTLPEYGEMDASEDKEPLIRAFNELILSAGYASVKGAPLKFKKADEAVLKERWRAGELGKYKVTELKAALSFYKLGTGGVKSELVERLAGALEARWGGR